MVLSAQRSLAEQENEGASCQETSDSQSDNDSGTEKSDSQYQQSTSGGIFTITCDKDESLGVYCGNVQLASSSSGVGENHHSQQGGSVVLKTRI